jgi:uncharacterized protein YraI
MEDMVSQMSINPQSSRAGRMLLAACVLVTIVFAGCTAASAPLSATITAPNANTQFMLGQPIDIQGKVTGNALRAVDVIIDSAKFTSVSVAAGTSEFSVSTSWVPTREGVHAVQFKGLNEKGEVLIASEAVVINVVAPTPTAGPTAVPPTAAPALASTTEAQPTAAAQPTAVAAPQGVSASPKEGDYVNVRQGPGYAYDKIGVINIGESAPMIGRNDDSSWWQIRFNGSDGAGVGWVVATLIQVNGDASAVAIAAAPPAPTAEPVAQAPTAQPAPAATQAPAPTAASQLPSYAQQPYSQRMFFTPRDDIGDVPLGIRAEDRVTVLAWEVYGATKLEMEVTAPKAPPLYNEQCVPGNLDTIQATSNYVARQRFPIDVPKGFIQFRIPGDGYYVFTIYVTKADGTTTSIPRPVIVERCYKNS